MLGVSLHTRNIPRKVDHGVTFATTIQAQTDETIVLDVESSVEVVKEFAFTTLTSTTPFVIVQNIDNLFREL